MGKLDWKHRKIELLSGGSLSSNLVVVARASNRNAEVLKECCNKVDDLEKRNQELEERIDKLESYLSSMAGYMANEGII